MSEFLDWISHHSLHSPTAGVLGEGVEAAADSGIEAALDNVQAKKKADESLLDIIENGEITGVGAVALMIGGVAFGPLFLGLFVKSPLKVISNIHYMILLWLVFSVIVFAPIFSVWGLQRPYKLIPNTRARAWVRGIVAFIAFLGTIAVGRVILTALGLTQDIQGIGLFPSS